MFLNPGLPGRLSLVALAVLLTLPACGDADEAVVVDADTVTVETAPEAPADALADDTADDLTADDVTPDAEPVPTGPDEAALEADAAADAAASEPAKAAAAPAPAAATGLSAVTFFNNTGMTISHLYIAGCDESEGNDWNDMRSWAQERLSGAALEPDASVVIEYADGCYVAEPHYVGEGPISEKVIVSGPTRVDFTIG